MTVTNIKVTCIECKRAIQTLIVSPGVSKLANHYPKKGDWKSGFCKGSGKKVI